jgi:hypothetical protein
MRKGAMRLEHHSWTYNLDTRFPHRRKVFGYEGGYTAIAEADGKFYIIVDEGPMADFLLPNDPVDAEVLGRLKTVMEFDTADERNSTLAKMVADHEATNRQRRMRTGG